MKAIVMTATGAPEVLALRDVPDPPRPAGHQLLVRVRAAGVNPIDTKLRSRGTYYPDRTGAILGCDAAGVIEAAGPEATRFAEGDEVYFFNAGMGGDPGSYAQYALVDDRYCARKPASLSFAQAAAVPLVLITAWESLHDRAGMREDQHVLIHAGAGGVGHVALQLAKIAGARVATTVSSLEKADLVAALGADAPILYKTTDFVAAARDWTQGIGVDVALDTVGGDVLEQTFPAMRLHGDLVTLLQPGPGVDWKEARLRNLRISLELMLSPAYYGAQQAREHQADILRRGAELFDAGRLRIELARTLPLAEAAEAHRMLERGGINGKLVLTVD